MSRSSFVFSTLGFFFCSALVLLQYSLPRRRSPLRSALRDSEAYGSGGRGHKPSVQFGFRGKQFQFEGRKVTGERQIPRQTNR